MPSPEATYYDIKRLHVIFAVAAIALLATTVWMLAVDHDRPWKQYQRTYQDRVEPWLTEAGIRAEQTAAFTAKEAELRLALEAARRVLPEAEQIDAFCRELERAGRDAGVDGIRAVYASAVHQPGPLIRDKLIAELSRNVDEADRRRRQVDRQLRFRKADFNEARSSYESGVGEGFSGQRFDELSQRVRRVKEKVDQLTLESEEAAGHHAALAAILGQITAAEETSQKAIAQHRAGLERMQRTLGGQRPSWGKRFLSLPGIDAFGSPLSIDQIWLPELTIDYNFRPVARFDRCTTCHLGIDKTQPGLASEPALPAEETLTVTLDTPREVPATEQASTTEQASATERASTTEEASTTGADDAPHGSSLVEKLYGFRFAPRGILDDRAATVELVFNQTPAAEAGLLTGDVIRQVGEVPLSDPIDAARRLTQQVEWGQPLQLTIRRGLPQPFGSHPRLDLYVGSSSPHPMSRFGCTICHQGQGAATEFVRAAHRPDDPAEAARWQEEHGWQRNHFWDFPMRPMRFAQSGCLQCHPEVLDLEESDRFEQSPAPKLLAGYRLVRDYGCFGCHEIKGVDDSGRRIGPDLRLEPNYHEAALELLADPALTNRQRTLAQQIVAHPEGPARRRQLVQELAGEAASSSSGGDDKLGRESRRAVELLAHNDPHPGTMRKVGPSLRDTAAKLDVAFLVGWLSEPEDILPRRKMPGFFGLHDHLEGRDLEDGRRFEAVEIRAIAEYLLSASQPVDPLGPPAGVTEAPSAARGEELFVRRGCVACHQHRSVPEAESVFGPDLSALGAKLTTAASHRWLTSWLRNPSRHSPRTLMPNMRLEPIAVAGDAGEPPRMTDPAADIAAFLLESPDRRPKPVAALVPSDLDELAMEHLRKLFPRKLAQQYLAEGIPQSMAGRIEGDAVELLGPMNVKKKLRYVGRRTIRKLGCYGCHDIPGFEAAQPVAPPLTDWGRKQPSLLAFEQVHRFVVPRGRGPSQATSTAEDAASSSAMASPSDDDRSFYLDALLGKRREGFLWQKLRAPRSFDYKKTENKPYNERLAMGRYSFNPAQREAIITFVLGLIAQPPAEKYVDRPDGPKRAIIEGRKVIEKYGCAECHVFRMEKWTFRYDPQWFEDFVGGPASADTFDFVQPHFSADELAASLETDARGWEEAQVVGTPYVDAEGEPIEDEDDDGNPILIFNLWEPAAIHGQIWRVGGMQVPVQASSITRKRLPWGGALGRLLYPRLAEEAGASWIEAWGWVPPALVHEGKAVRPQWLYDYLLDPVRIRPSVVLRMPKYNLSPEEAGKLVNYFAAVAGTDFPYTPRSALPSGQPIDPARRKRMEDALRLVIDRTTFCAKCHLIGDFNPGGETKTTLAPRLDRVGRRIRAEYLRRWLADPKSVLPYTGMPVNFPPRQDPLGQDLYPGTSLEQIDAVIDLLLNYDWLMNRRTSIRVMIEENTQGGLRPQPK